MILTEPTTIDPASPQLEREIDALAAGAGVYAIWMRDAAPHLSSCAFLRARVRRLLGDSAAVSKQRLREQVERIDCWAASSRLETWLLLLALALRSYPREYERKLRLRRPWFVGLSSDRFPRLLALSRLPEDGVATYGPFPTRDAAAAYAEAAAGLFQIRKCPDLLLPSPDHPGCIYGEMNQCVRPCQCAVSDEEYRSEAARVDEFLRTNGMATRSALLVARERASEKLDFEAAAHLHKRLDRLSAATALRDEPAGLLNGFGGVAITKSLQPGAVRLWRMRESVWLAPLDIAVKRTDAESQPLDARLRGQLSEAAAAALPAEADRSAHLAILLRWYRSSYRDGEWVPEVPGKGISYRKVVGAISRLMKDEAA